MTTMELIRALRLRLEELKSSGSTAVDLDSLHKCLAAAEADASEMPQVFDARDVSLMEAGFRAHENTLKSALVVNGGAAVALLAFVGNLATKATGGLSMNGFGRAMLIFAAGVLLAGVGQAVTHFLALLGLKGQSDLAGWTNLVVMFLVVAAFTAFGWGTWEAFKAIHS